MKVEADLLKLAEAAQYLRVHPATLRRLIRIGQVPATRAGQSIRIARTSIDNYLRRRAIGGAA